MEDASSARAQAVAGEHYYPADDSAIMHHHQCAPSHNGTMDFNGYRDKLSVVLPSYNESRNLPILLTELAEQNSDAAFVGRVIIVDDDSPDGTAELIKSNNWPVTFRLDCIHRKGRSGLSSAVIEGVMLADTDWIAVMDADLQHDPRDLRELYLLALSDNLDIAIGSRFMNGECVANHAGHRGLFSSVGNYLAVMAIGRHLKDPLSGLFVARRSLVAQAATSIQAAGFKVLLDLLAENRNTALRVKEKQITFRARGCGESKLDAAVLLEFASQVVARLSRGLFPATFVRFSAVGGSGIFVHMALLSVLISFNVPFVPAQSAATLGAIFSNFTLNNLFTFRRSRLRGSAWYVGLLKFVTACSLGAVANVGAAGFLNDAQSSWWVSGLAGVAVGTIFNYTISRSFVWKT